MDHKILKVELDQIDRHRGELEAELLQCKERRDRVQKKRIEKELKVLASRSKHLLFKLGKYKYPEDEVSEYSPGQFMSARVRHWLMD